MKILLVIFLLQGCSYFDRDNTAKDSNNVDLGALQAKFDTYIGLSEETQDENGWINGSCDALLHTAIFSASGGTDFPNLLKARNDSGQWFRRPSMDCLSTGNSKSTISRDMFLGLAIAIAVEKDLETIRGIVEYAKANDFKMGDNDGSIDGVNRVYFTPGFYNLMLGVEDYIEGKKADVDELEPEAQTALVQSYKFTDHLDVLSIFLKGYIKAGLTDSELERLRKLARLDPNNALVHAVKSKHENGDQKTAVDILMREDLFPSDRLPTSKDRCTDYLWMHGEKPGDWGPCDDKEIHPGHDFLFAAWIILNSKKGE